MEGVKCFMRVMRSYSSYDVRLINNSGRFHTLREELSFPPTVKMKVIVALIISWMIFMVIGSAEVQEY